MINDDDDDDDVHEDLHTSFLKTISINLKSLSFTKEIKYINNPLQEDYIQIARVNLHLQRKADRLRMENLLNPILQLEHRQKIWQQIWQKYFNLQDDVCPASMKIPSIGPI